jgi:molybdenum cofactor biosynthesis enzyme MoaA
MTHFCNLECEYCYAFKSKENFELDKFIAVGNELINQGVKKANLSGGEPFINKCLLSVVDYFYKKIDLSITTNGTIGTKEHLLCLKNKLDRLTISVDTIDSDLGHILRSDKCDTNKILEFTNDAIKLDFNIKINTVVSENNKYYLEDIGKWLYSFNRKITWKLFQITNNQNIETNIKKLLIDDFRFNKLVQSLVNLFPNLNIQKATSFDLNHHYIIITPEGNIQIPYLNNYKSIGNVLTNNLNKILKSKDYNFQENKREYSKQIIL